MVLNLNQNRDNWVHVTPYLGPYKDQPRVQLRLREGVTYRFCNAADMTDLHFWDYSSERLLRAPLDPGLAYSGFSVRVRDLRVKRK